MTINDHSRCDPAQCASARSDEAVREAEAQQDLEDKANDEQHEERMLEARLRLIHEQETVQAKAAVEAEYYARSRKRRIAAERYGRTEFGAVDAAEAHQGHAHWTSTHESPASWRKRKVELLEAELLSARAEQAQHGELGPLQPLRNVVGDALRLAEVKEEQYRGAWRRQGYMGNLARVLSKAARLEALLWTDYDASGQFDEGIQDTLLDLMNLAGFMAVNYSEGNRWGR